MDNNTQPSSVMNFAAPLCAPIKTEFQPQVTGISLRMMGEGNWKVELKDSADRFLKVWGLYHVSSTHFTDVTLPVPDPSLYPAAKLLTFVVESSADVTLDHIRFVHRSAPATRYDNLLYGFVGSYNGMRNCADDVTGLTQDHGNWPSGHFDSAPATGFQALSAAMAFDLGVINRSDAERITGSSVRALVNVPKYKGLAPHFLKDGVIHPNSEFSTVDTALAYHSALLATIVLDLPVEKALIQGLIDAMDWPSLTNAQNQVTHGFMADLTQIPWNWVATGCQKDY